MGYGVWSIHDKRFMFGVNEPNKKLAERAFLKRAGFPVSWCHKVRLIPDGWVNPKNPRERDYKSGRLRSWR